jgi:hypothetical protein
MESALVFIIFMGISLSSARFLVSELRQGVNLSRTLALGRQGVFIQYNQYKDIGLLLNVETPRYATFAENLFNRLGAEALDVLGTSSYEGATLIHDLNQPLPRNFSKNWSCVTPPGKISGTVKKH